MYVNCSFLAVKSFPYILKTNINEYEGYLFFKRQKEMYYINKIPLIVDFDVTTNV